MLVDLDEVSSIGEMKRIYRNHRDSKDMTVAEVKNTYVPTFIPSGISDNVYIEFSTIAATNPISLGNKATPCIPGPFDWRAKVNKEEGNTPMYTESATVNVNEVTGADKRAYLEKRLSTIEYGIRRKLPNQFNLYVDSKPKSADVMIAAIKAGEYTIDDALVAAAAKAIKDCETWFYYKGDEYRATDPFLGLEFTALPKPDRVGYDAAISALDAAKTAVLDQVKIADPKDALPAVQAFEGWTFTAPTTATVQ